MFNTGHRRNSPGGDCCCLRSSAVPASHEMPFLPVAWNLQRTGDQHQRGQVMKQARRNIVTRSFRLVAAIALAGAAAQAFA
ncbi:hypothetical protein, partial [Pseudoduganella dura]|uniref:hypothetical protein n=1 Tax=Pseudoduganella dura TaxID=321982 RepID=UPI001E55AD21